MLTFWNENNAHCGNNAEEKLTWTVAAKACQC